MKNNDKKTSNLYYKIDFWKSMLNFSGILFVAFSIFSSFVFFELNSKYNSMENSLNRIDRSVVEIPMYYAKIQIKNINEGKGTEEEKYNKIKEISKNIDSLEDEYHTLNNYIGNIENTKTKNYDNSFENTLKIIEATIFIPLSLSLISIYKLNKLKNEVIE